MVQKGLCQDSDELKVLIKRYVSSGFDKAHEIVKLIVYNHFNEVKSRWPMSGQNVFFCTGEGFSIENLTHRVADKNLTMFFLRKFNIQMVVLAEINFLNNKVGNGSGSCEAATVR